MGKDGLDVGSWPTSSRLQLNACPSVLLSRWDHLLLSSYAVDHSSGDSFSTPVEDFLQI
jgi:hypothetical protein